MADYCLPKKHASAFLKALKDGTINPAQLMDMTSAERRTFFSGLIGEDNAAGVNALFESKMLLKDQQRGLMNWAKQVAGISEPVRRDLVAKISKLDRILQPEDEDSFLADLAAKKLGVAVTAEEAQEIYDLSRKVETARAAMEGSANDAESRIQYGLAYQDLTERVESMKPDPKQGFLHIAADVLNIPRTLLTLGHFSAPFVQGWGLISTRQWAEGYGQMVQFFRNEDNYRRLNAAIIGHPDYELATRAGLSLTKLGDKLSAREEAIQSTLVEKANEWLKEKTGVPNIARAGSRAFTGYLNYVRWRTFTDLVGAARLAGEDMAIGSSAAADIARTVNNFSGRGSLGPLESSDVSSVLNAVFFAPRKIAGTVQMFNPVNVLNPAVSQTARIAHMRLLMGSIVATGAILGVARMMGASIDLDPRSTDFAKIKIGGTKLDVTGGNDIYVRLIGRLVSGQEITSKEKLITLGDGYKPTTRADLVLNFMRGKLAPVASVLADALYGTDPVGRPFSVTQEMRDKLVPITIGSFINFAENDPNNTAAILPSLAAIFGVGLEPPLPPAKGRERTIWGEKISNASPPAENDPVNRALNRIGYSPGYPAHAIRGVKLSDQQYDEYVQRSGRLAHARLSQIVRMPGFSALPIGRQEDVMRKTVSDMRDMAATQMMMKNRDIIREATQAKRARAVQGSSAAIKQRATGFSAVTQ